MRRSFRAPRIWGIAALGGLVLSFAPAANATVVERVVAIVGEQAVLLSQLRERAKPFLQRLDQADGAQRAAAISQLYGQLVQRLVEEELEQKAANRANITITAREVDDALGRIAQQNGVSIDRVVEEATKSGMNEAAYRQEIRRQLLEAKLLNLRIQGRLRITEEDVRAAYQKLVLDERRSLGFELAWIRVPAPRGTNTTELKAARTQAEGIVSAARRGDDFGALARKHSTDPRTAERGGRLGKLKPGQLPPHLDNVALGLDAGSVSEPVRDGEDFVILKVVARDESQLPTYDDSKDELGQRVYMEKMGKAKQHWLNGLKRQTHVEVRL